MKTRLNKTTFALCLVMAILYIANIFPAGAAMVLPEGLVMENTFSPGRGRPVGKVQQVQGDVVIMHAKVLKGYKAVRGVRLYKGDSIMTLEDGRVRFKLNDGSILSLASETKMKITKSVYQKKKKRRSSFFQMALGKARLLVVKALGFKRSEFKVKTPTAVCGVRGSDFILEVTDTETIATALAETELEFQSLAFLEEPPMILRDYETSSVRLGQRASTPTRLPDDEINRMKKVFIDVESDDESDSEDVEDDQAGVEDDTGIDEVGKLGDEMNLEKIVRDDSGGDRDFKNMEKNIQPITPSGIDDIKETITEEIIGGELPEFPELPQTEQPG